MLYLKRFFDYLGKIKTFFNLHAHFLLEEEELKESERNSDMKQVGMDFRSVSKDFENSIEKLKQEC